MAPRKKKAAVEVTDVRSYQLMYEGSHGFLSHVSSNIKGGVAAPLGACTAIVSNRNRAGKTAVLDSIRFALTGQHPIGAHYADLCGLTIDGAAPWAKLLNSEGITVADSHVPSGKKSVIHEDTLQISESNRSGLLPMSSVRDLLTLGTAKAREEVFRRFGGALDSIPVPVELNDEQLELWERVTNETKRNDPSEWLTAAGESIRSYKRQLSSTVKSLEEEKARLLADIEGDTTDEIKSLEERIAAAEKAQTFANLLKTRDEVTQQLNDEIESFTQRPVPPKREQFDARPAVAERAQALTAAKQHLADTAQAHQARLGSLVSAKRILTFRKHLAGGCLVCEAAEPSQERQNELVEIMQGLVTALETDLRPAQVEIERLEVEYRRLEQEQVMTANREEREWRDAVAAYANAQKRLTDLGEHYKRLDKSLSDAGVVESPDVELLPALRQKHDLLTKAKNNRERITEIKARIRQTVNEQEDAKVVEGAIGDSLNKLLEKIKGQAEAAVNKWMPDMFRAVLQLEDTEGKSVCRWEVIGTDKRAHPRNAASGAEWSALTVALACAWAEASRYKFVLLDDADLGGFSAGNVENVLHTLQQAVERGDLTQVFVAWSRPEEIPRNGWTVVSP